MGQCFAFLGLLLDFILQTATRTGEWVFSRQPRKQASLTCREFDMLRASAILQEERRSSYIAESALPKAFPKGDSW